MQAQSTKSYTNVFGRLTCYAEVGPGLSSECSSGSSSSRGKVASNQTAGNLMCGLLPTCITVNLRQAAAATAMHAASAYDAAGVAVLLWLQAKV
jgi:hypothetical protein